MSENIRQIINLNNNRNICKIKGKCSNQSHSQTYDLSMKNKKLVCENCKSIVCQHCIMWDKQKCAICLYNPKIENCVMCNDDIVILICNSCEKKIQICKYSCMYNVVFYGLDNKKY